MNELLSPRKRSRRGSFFPARDWVILTFGRDQPSCPSHALALLQPHAIGQRPSRSMLARSHGPRLDHNAENAGPHLHHKTPARPLAGKSGQGGGAGGAPVTGGKGALMTTARTGRVLGAKDRNLGKGSDPAQGESRSGAVRPLTDHLGEARGAVLRISEPALTTASRRCARPAVPSRQVIDVAGTRSAGARESCLAAPPAAASLQDSPSEQSVPPSTAAGPAHAGNRPPSEARAAFAARFAGSFCGSRSGGARTDARRTRGHRS